MSVEIKIFGETAKDALKELFGLSDGLGPDTAGGTLSPTLGRFVGGSGQTGASEVQQGADVSAAAVSDMSTDAADTPKRERGKPSPGRARRTKEEIAEDEAADAADAAQQAEAAVANISTGEERINPEEEAQDAADEAADPVNAPADTATRDDVRAARLAHRAGRAPHPVLPESQNRAGQHPGSRGHQPRPARLCAIRSAHLRGAMPGLRNLRGNHLGRDYLGRGRAGNRPLALPALRRGDRGAPQARHGRGRPLAGLRPEVQGHAGFRLNALVSLHANAAWSKLATEFLAAKDDPTTLQTFVNTILGQGWRADGEELDESALMARAEPFGLDLIPAGVLALTVGCDVQHDRIELTYCGFTDAGQMMVLGHRVIWGAWDAEETWAELDGLLTERFPHELGDKMAIDAAAIDAGDGATMHRVTDFCRARTRRKVVAIKGAPGNRPVIEKAGSKTKTGARLWIVGVDTVKTQLFGRIGNPAAVRFSAGLPAVWYEQATSERAVIRYSRGQSTRQFVRIPGKRAEALDCLVYATAARQLVQINPDDRRAALSQVEAAPPGRRGPITQSRWMQRT